jgi:AraC family transcriptional regulator
MTPLATVLDRPSASRSATIAALGVRLHREFKLADGASALSIEGLLLELLAQVIRCSTPRSGSKPPAWLRQAQDYLHAHFSDDLSLREAANRVGVHPVHLARVYKHYHKCTIGEYVRNLRIEFAQRELVVSHTPLADIALAAGFCAQSHFSTAFKRQLGLTPAEYRASIRSREKHGS